MLRDQKKREDISLLRGSRPTQFGSGSNSLNNLKGMKSPHAFA